MAAREHDFDEDISDAECASSFEWLGVGADGQSTSGGGFVRNRSLLSAIDEGFGAERFRSLTAEQLFQHIQLAASAVTDVTDLSFDDAVLALHAYRWRAEALLEDFFANGTAAFRARVGVRDGVCDGVPTPTSKPPPSGGAGDTTITSTGAVTAGTAFCAVELADFPIDEMAALPCGHSFSRDAWRSSLTFAMNDANAAQLARCLGAPGCNELVRVEFAAAFLPPADAARRAEFSVRRFVDDSRSITWCPGADCAFAVAARGGVEGVQTKDVTCAAGHAFCFTCGRPPHRPATCRDLAEWERRETSDGLSFLWMREHTKPCVKCACRVERSSGCNKVVCTRCGTAMCWACGLEYYTAAGHAYPAGAWTCNRPPASFSFHRSSSSDKDLMRFGHYRTRVVSSAQSAQIATREAPLVAECIDELASLVAQAQACGGGGARAGAGAPALPLHSSHFDFFVRGLTAVRNAREYLRGTYVRAFSLKDEVELALFADQQSVLEGTAEKLQQLVEYGAVQTLLQDVARQLSVPTRAGSGAGGGAGSPGAWAVAASGGRSGVWARIKSGAGAGAGASVGARAGAGAGARAGAGAGAGTDAATAAATAADPGKGAGAGDSPASLVANRIITLRIEVLSLMSAIEGFTRNLTEMIQTCGGLSAGVTPNAVAVVDTTEGVTFDYDDADITDDEGVE